MKIIALYGNATRARDPPLQPVHQCNKPNLLPSAKDTAEEVMHGLTNHGDVLCSSSDAASP
jgi:hypothetical protein